MKRQHTLCAFVALVLGTAVLASARAGAPQAAPPKVSDIAAMAVALVDSRSSAPLPLDGYLVLMCTSDREDALAKDSDIGAFVRQMKRVKSNLAAVLMPSGSASGPTFVVYFDTAAPLGYVEVAAGTVAVTDSLVAAAYVQVTGAVAKGARRPDFTAGKMKADDGTEIYTLKIVGWDAPEPARPRLHPLSSAVALARRSWLGAT